MLNESVEIITNVTSVSITRPITHNRNLLVILSLTAALATAFTILSNTTVIVAMVSSCIRRPAASNGHSNNGITQILMTSMAASDALVGAAMMPLATSEMVNNGQWIWGTALNRYRSLFNMLLCTVSIYHVFCMAIDRYLAVCWPLMYHKLSPRTGLYMVISVWIFPIALFIIPIALGWGQCPEAKLKTTEYVSRFCTSSFEKTFGIVGSFLTFFIPFAIVFVLYFLILVQVRKFHKGRFSKFLGKLCSGRFAHHQTNTSQEHELADKRDTVSRLLENDSCSIDINNENSVLSHGNQILELRTAQQSKYHAPASGFFAGMCTDTRPQPSNIRLENAIRVHDALDIKIERTNVNSESQTKVSKNEVFKISLPTNSFVRENFTNASHTKISASVSFKGKAESIIIKKLGSKCRSEQNSSRPKSSSMKAYQTIGLIVVVFTVCWSPFAFYHFATGGVPEKDIPRVIITSLSWLGYFNSSLNPLVFCCHRRVRDSVRRLLCY